MEGYSIAVSALYMYSQPQSFDLPQPFYLIVL